MRTLVILMGAGAILWAFGQIARTPVQNWQREHARALSCQVAVMTDRWDVAERRCPR